MPIKDWSKYPANWKTEIRPAVLKRAHHSCENCGIGNYAVVNWNKKHKRWDRACGNIHIDAYGLGECTYQEARLLADHWNEVNMDDIKWVVIVLTIAHLNHDVTDNKMDNLAALCQRCHLSLDKEHHRQNAKATIEKKKGLQSLF